VRWRTSPSRPYSRQRLSFVYTSKHVILARLSLVDERSDACTVAAMTADCQCESASPVTLLLRLLSPLSDGPTPLPCMVFVWRKAIRRWFVRSYPLGYNRGSAAEQRRRWRRDCTSACHLVSALCRVVWRSDLAVLRFVARVFSCLLLWPAYMSYTRSSSMQRKSPCSFAHVFHVVY
jgi:hypothetical protein